MAQQRRKRGRFDAAYTDRELYTVVREVATATRPEKPELLTQRQFDAAKDGCGYGDAPTARGICARLVAPNGRPTPWRKVVKDALRGDLETVMVEQARTREAAAAHVDERFAHYSLRRIAAHLGSTTVHRADYEPARAKLVDQDRKRWGMTAKLDQLLITEGQILTVYRSWEAALAAAGLDERPVRKKASGMPRLEAIGHFVKHNGRLPSEHELKRIFAPKAGFTLALADRRHAEYLEQYRDQCRERGGPVPPGPPTSGRPAKGSRAIIVPTGGIAGPGSKPRGYWTQERCLDALEAWDASLPSGVERTIPAYKRSRAAAEPGSMPNVDTIQTHCGTFTKAMEEVRRRRRAAAA